MAAHAHGITGGHKVETVLARHGAARPQALVGGICVVDLLASQLLSVRHVSVIPRRHADRMDGTINQK
eukprot:4815159-Heterocapsa_arctica.AAC.1